MEARLRGLHVLADDAPAWRHDPVEQARAGCRGGASVVQLRAKLTGDRDALAWAEQIRALTRTVGALFVVNDRFDLALASEADGVHLGQDDLPPRRVPAWARERLLLGRSTHTLDQVRRAREEPVDYVAFGPVFGTRSKRTPWDARGPRALAEVVAIASPLPTVAIGGIHAGNAGEIAGQGAGAAVISAVAAALDPERAVRELAKIVAGGAP